MKELIPNTSGSSLAKIFSEDRNSPFGAVDSNLQAWL